MAQKASQREIFRSGKYYFHTEYGKDTVRLKETCKKGLMQAVASGMRTSDKWNDRSKIILPPVNYLIVPLVEEYKVIAYVKKNNIRIENKISVAEIKSSDSLAGSGHANNQKKEITKKLGNERKEIFNPHDKLKKMEPVKNTDLSHVPPLIRELVKTEDDRELIKKILTYRDAGKLAIIKDIEKYMQVYPADNIYEVRLNPENGKVLSLSSFGDDRDLRTGMKITKTNEQKIQKIWLKIY